MQKCPCSVPEDELEKLETQRSHRPYRPCVNRSSIVSTRAPKGTGSSHVDPFGTQSRSTSNGTEDRPSSRLNLHGQESRLWHRPGLLLQRPLLKPDESVPEINQELISAFAELNQPLAMTIETSITDPSIPTRISSDLGYSTPHVWDNTVLDSHKCPEMAYPFPNSLPFFSADGELIQDFTLYPSSRATSDPPALDEIEIPMTSTMPERDPAQIEDHSSRPSLNEEPPVKCLGYDMRTTVDTNALHSVRETPPECISRRPASCSVGHSVPPLPSSIPTKSPDFFEDTDSTVSSLDSMTEEGDFWIPDETNLRTSDLSQESTSIVSATETDAFSSCNFEDWMSDPSLTSFTTHGYITLDVGGTSSQALANLNHSTIELIPERPLESDLYLCPANNYVQQQDSFTIAHPSTSQPPPLKTSAPHATQTDTPSDMMLSPGLKWLSETPQDAIELQAWEDFLQSRQIAEKALTSANSPDKVTDKDCPSHIEYRQSIRRHGKLSEIPELSDWYSSPDERRRQWLGLPGTDNPIDDKISALLASFESAMQKLHMRPQRYSDLDVEVQGVIQSLLSQLSEPDPIMVHQYTGSLNMGEIFQWLRNMMMMDCPATLLGPLLCKT